MTVRTTRSHGTHAKYVVDKCRCTECRAANTAYERARTRRVAPPYVDATEAREHIAWLSTQGVGMKTVAQASGMSHSAIIKIVYGNQTRGMAPSKRIRPQTAARILAVTPADAADGARVDATRTWEQVNDLVAAGMPRRQIAEHLGQTRALNLGRSLVTARSARIIADLHRQYLAGTLTYEDRWRGRRRTIHVQAPTSVTMSARQVDRWNEATRRGRYRGTTPRPFDDVDQVTLDLATALETRIDQTWRTRAACNGHPPWLWFPTQWDRETVAAAKNVCDTCPVRQECLDAGRDEPHGIWGGLLPHERRALTKNRALTEDAA